MPNIAVIETFISNDPSTQRYMKEDEHPKSSTFIQQNVANSFHTPMYYNKTKTRHSLDKSLIKDLEILDTEEEDGSPLLDHVFGNTSDLGKLMRPEMAKYYSSDRKFLNDTKKVLKRVIIEDCQCNENTETPEDIFKIWPIRRPQTKLV